MKTKQGIMLQMNVPEFFKDLEFIGWLNCKTAPATVATWHQGGVPHEFSDTFVLVDPSLNGEGSDSDMPEHIWNQIVEECRRHIIPNRDLHIVVWLTNIEA